tara:strand:- start:49 stop:528 length:480 start_codon:yes stop_codon:yes gene_type:complete
MAKERKIKLLDIGCGPNKAKGYIGMDHWPFDGVDVVRDLRRGFPFADDTFDGVLAKQILEHFNGEDLIFIMEEIWRVCKKGAGVDIFVPNNQSPNGGKDYTHKKTDWDQWSFQMWEKKDGVYIIERGPMYGIVGEFRVTDMRFDATGNGDQYYNLEVIK